MARTLVSKTNYEGSSPSLLAIRARGVMENMTVF